ncbi:MAG: prepilin-type N-terminal cleavage/methylation domain-containing protein [Candidatus Pacebacteria bacterium]|nr:prepilin-type N-terminal cleavage/methylation domain-containing protein [Candidatus Paceibacterota bacterium]
MKQRQQPENKLISGFTLIELLVVIAIIGLLASIILASLNTARQKGRDARRVSDIKSIQLALELYFDQNSYYPQQSAALSTSPSSDVLPIAQLVPVYIASAPSDPSGSTPYHYQYQSLDSTGAICTESDPTQCTGYLLVANLEAGANNSTWSGTLPSGDPANLCTDGTGSPYPYCVHS